MKERRVPVGTELDIMQCKLAPKGGFMSEQARFRNSSEPTIAKL